MFAVFDFPEAAIKSTTGPPKKRVGKEIATIASLESVGAPPGLQPPPERPGPSKPFPGIPPEPLYHRPIAII